MNPIYLDYNATTPLDPLVMHMEPFLRERFGNPSSAHAYGHVARDAVERARQQIAALVGVRPGEIVFTGGGSEASNLALKGVIFDALAKSPAQDLHIVTSAVEHPATLEPCTFLSRLGCRVTVVPVDGQGLVDLKVLQEALRQGARLVSIMHANNEVGTIQPIPEIAALAREHGALVHTDAAQSTGKIDVKIDVKVDDPGADLLSIAGHKLYAPKGIGALYVRDGVALEPLIHGAGHEGSRRAGTENVPYIVALGAACEIADRSLPAATRWLQELRDRLWRCLRDGLGDRVALNGHPERRLPNTLNVNFVGCVGAELLEATPEIAASTGSACHEGQVSLSPVLAAMGVSPELGRGAVRLSVGRFTEEADVDQAGELLLQAVGVRQR